MGFYREIADLLAFPLCCAFFMPSRLFVFLSRVVSEEVCGIRLYRFLIIAFLSIKAESSIHPFLGFV